MRFHDFFSKIAILKKFRENAHYLVLEKTFTALVEDVGGCWRLEATAAAVVEVVVICSIGPVEEGFETITIGCLVLV